MVETMAEPVLMLDGVETAYGLSQVLFGVSLAIAPGEMVTLMGRNGMGKTTTVRSIMGLTPARAGTIRFSGAEIRGLPSYRIAQLGIGLVPEGRQIFPNLSVRENLVATASAQNGAGWTLAKVNDLFPKLAERGGSMGNQLSGGEQQMLAIGRALMTNPRLLILDEATEGLAPLIRAEIWRCLARLKEFGAFHPGDRQERRCADESRRPAFPHRAGKGGVVGRLSRTRRRAGYSTQILGRLTYICFRRPAAEFTPPSAPVGLCCEASGRLTTGHAGRRLHPTAVKVTAPPCIALRTDVLAPITAAFFS